MLDRVRVFADVLADPQAYRRAALQRKFETLTFGPNEVFQGIAAAADVPELPAWIVARFPALHPRVTFFRRSPLGQVEPTYIHSDAGMGDWTGILYLNENPPERDGTLFWRHKETDRIESGDDFSGDGEFQDFNRWSQWKFVRARFNQLVLFPAHHFHSRALFKNHGDGDGARLIQVVFGDGEGL